MSCTADASDCFVLEAFDCEDWCPVAQAPFHVADVAALQSILGLANEVDPELAYNYPLDDEQIAATA